MYMYFLYIVVGRAESTQLPAICALKRTLQSACLSSIVLMKMQLLVGNVFPSGCHFQIFTVQLTLGEQVWEAEGTSIKKAQHSTAAKALAESVLPRPAPRSPKADINSNPGTATKTESLLGWDGLSLNPLFTVPVSVAVSLIADV